MNNQEIFDLMDRFAGSGLRRMKLTREGFSLELERGGAGVESAAAAAIFLAGSIKSSTKWLIHSPVRYLSGIAPRPI